MGKLIIERMNQLNRKAQYSVTRGISSTDMIRSNNFETT